MTDIERLRERIYTMIAERDAERKTYNDAIAGHLAEVEQMRALLNAVRIWMKNIDRRPTEEPLYQAIRAALEPKP